MAAPPLLAGGGAGGDSLGTTPVAPGGEAAGGAPVDGGEGESIWVRRIAGGAATLALRLRLPRAAAEAAVGPASGSALADAVGALELLCAAARRLHPAGGVDGGGWVAPAVPDGWGGKDGAGAGLGAAVGDSTELRCLGEDAPHISIV